MTKKSTSTPILTNNADDAMCAVLHGQRDWEVSGLIGKGTFGSVYAVSLSGEHKRHNYVVKKIPMTKFGADSAVNEYRIMYGLNQGKDRNEHIATLRDAAQSYTALYLVMDRGNMDLFDAIDTLYRNTLLMTNDAIKNVFLQLADAVDFCHKRGVSHRDIKPGNIVVTSSFLETCTVKLIDFGLATFDRFSRDTCGSAEFMSPEVYAGVYHDTQAADVWSMGVVLYNMIAVEQPWDRPDQVSDARFCRYLRDRSFPTTTKGGVRLSKESARLFDLIFQHRRSLLTVAMIVQDTDSFREP